MEKIKQTEKDVQLGRRDFLKIAPATAALGAIGLASVPNKTAAKVVDKEIKKITVVQQDEFPNEIRADYKPPRNYDQVFAHALFGEILMAHGKDVDKDLIPLGKSYAHKLTYDFEKGKKGYDQLGKAMASGGWSMCYSASGPMPAGVGEFGVMSWDQHEDKNPQALIDVNFVAPEKHTFSSKTEASNAIKRAAKLFGADLVGITQRDERWDYSEFINPVPPLARGTITPPPPEMMPHVGEMMKAHLTSGDAFYGWEKCSFKPKTVIVLAFEMDYEAISTSPSEVAAAGVGDGYSRMTKTSSQLAVFLKQLGYHAFAAGNDTSLSIPYGIAAGLGEGSRSGLLVTYNYGPRVRLAKVYTDLDLVEYDKPRTFGVMEFCKSCKRCADSCPSKAISQDDYPSFEPTHDNKENAFYNNKGVKKYYVDCKKCFEFWEQNGVECSNCLASCPYNKPDFWHHRMVNKIGRLMPGAMHDMMREMDIVFGYGNVGDEKAVDKFFDSEGKNYNGF